jgi:pyridoxamine 5'-phosphate oxidase
MSEWLKKYRENHADFDKGSLNDVGTDPFIAFSAWFDEAVNHGEAEANAFVLSTATTEEGVSSRIVYLKELKDERFVFYTNYLSQKGQQIAAHSKVSMLFFWPGLQRQLRIEGTAEKIAEQESDAYFASRPRESQLGAWASRQSETLEGAGDLIAAFEQYDQQFPNDVPRPPHWGGYAIQATSIEFWQGRPSRLHDRVVFVAENGSWKQIRKNP